MFNWLKNQKESLNPLSNTQQGSLPPPNFEEVAKGQWVVMNGKTAASDKTTSLFAELVTLEDLKVYKTKSGSWNPNNGNQVVKEETCLIKITNNIQLNKLRQIGVKYGQNYLVYIKHGIPELTPCIMGKKSTKLKKIQKITENITTLKKHQFWIYLKNGIGGVLK